MDLPAALSAWSGVVGPANVLSSGAGVHDRSVATFATTQEVTAVLRPGTRVEVQECMRIANRFLTPVYPVSTGRNWGYGSGVPVRSGVILDLSRLNRIVDYNDRLGYLTLEPGVTQGQLYDFLRARGARFWMDATGSSAACSIVGNTVERGFGHTPYADHFASVCCMEVVLPSGECVRTGFSRFHKCKAAAVYRWGVGPYVDGLFTQSNLGIVTQLTIWLMPAPQYFQAFFFSVEEDRSLQTILQALVPLRMDGTLPSAVHLGNDYRALSSIRQYPWEQAAHTVPLSAAIVRQLSEAWDFGAWNGLGGLYGTRRQVSAARARLTSVLKGKVKVLRFLDDDKLQRAAWLQKPYRWITGRDLGETLKLLSPVYGLLKGVPTDAVLASTYWRKPTPIPVTMNPDADRCGLIWCAPVCPADPVDARAVVNIVYDVFRRHPFEPAISMTMITERSLSTIIGIAYDRDVPGEDERAMACYQELFDRLMHSGYYPYRLGIQSMGQMVGEDIHYQALLRTLKTALDPNNILAPGRYE